MMSENTASVTLSCTPSWFATPMIGLRAMGWATILCHLPLVVGLLTPATYEENPFAPSHGASLEILNALFTVTFYAAIILVLVGAYRMVRPGHPAWMALPLVAGLPLIPAIPPAVQDELCRIGFFVSYAAVGAVVASGLRWSLKQRLSGWVEIVSTLALIGLAGTGATALYTATLSPHWFSHNYEEVCYVVMFQPQVMLASTLVLALVRAIASLRVRDPGASTVISPPEQER